MNRQVVHIDMDSFFVSVERLQDRRLHGIPLLIGGTTDRGVVAACSYEARRYGVHSAMPMRTARMLCPEALVIRGNSLNYSKYSDMVADVLRAEVPVLEKSSIDEFYIDMTGMDRYHNSFRLMSLLRQKVVKETGLPVSFGFSVNKTVAKVATGEAKPNNQYKVPYGFEREFLSPLPVGRIPMVGDKMQQTLLNMGVRRVDTLQKMSPELLQSVFGDFGLKLWKKVNVEDDTPVIPYSERKSLSTERTFERDTIDVVKLRGLITAMTENLAFQLRRGNKLTACITVKVRYADFNTHTLQRRIPYTTSDHVLIPAALELFDRLYNRRLRVRLIGVRMSHLVGGGQQMQLFDEQERIMGLYTAMDKMKKRYGDRAVVRAVGLKARTIGRPNPFDGMAPLLLANRRQ
jgi:DNA polymerase-4